MAERRQKASARREPAEQAPEVRVDPEDRVGRGSKVPRSAKSPRAPSERTRSRKRRKSGRGIGSVFGRMIYWSLVATLWVGIAGVGVVIWIGAHLPPIDQLAIPKRPPSIQIQGLDGRVLATRGDMGGSAVPLREMPPYLPAAFIAIEDRRFYSHFGVDPVGVFRAATANVLRRGVAQGGSTLTQQLAKNLFLTPDRTIHRKAQELVLALWLERKYSKAQILDLYLNRVYFGSGAYGVEAAAQKYFGKSARQVNVAEAAVLAGLVKSPSRLAPTRNPDAAHKRAQLVLAAMVDNDAISAATAKQATANPAQTFKPSGGGSVNYVADWIMDVLNDLVGRFENDLVVETTIDPALQILAEKALVDELAQKGEKFDVGQGAIVSMTPEGAVRALVGGRNYSESQFNRAVAAKRQPGSAFKPFVYLTALERGLTPETVREDKPVAIKGWKPENYTREYFGNVTLTQALAHSLNTISVRLTLEVTPQAVVRTAHRMGIASKLEPNASIALGTSEVSVIELVGAFAVLANGGQAAAPHVVERVKVMATGKTLYARQKKSLGQVVAPQYVAMMNAMMQETLLTGTARKAALPGWSAAGKTGTSQDFRDAWFVGYTAQLVTGVWLGNDDSSPTKKATGGGLPVEVWSRYMRAAHHGVPVAALPGSGSLRTPVAEAQGGPITPMAPPGNIPAPQTVAAPARGQPPQADGGLDGWFIDRLFGRR